MLPTKFDTPGGPVLIGRNFHPLFLIGDSTVKHVIIGAVLILVVAMSTHPAKADLTVCNQTTAGQIDVAVAYHYVSGSDAYSRSEGYWNIPQGECRNTLSLTGYEKVYVFAWVAADKTKMWSGANGSGHESGAKQFCIDGNGGAFTYKGDDAIPPCSSPGESRMFRLAGTADQDGDYTYNFGD